MNNFKINNIQYMRMKGDRHTTFDVYKIVSSGEPKIHGIFVLKGWVDVLTMINKMTDEEMEEIFSSSKMIVETQPLKH